MKPADKDIRSRIRRFRIQASTERHRDTLGCVLAAHEQSKKSRPAGTDQPAQKRKRTMKTLKWLTPTAVAACVVIALAAWWAMSGPPITQTAYAELMQVIENSNAAEWMHFNTVIKDQDFEIWLSVNPLRKIQRTSQSIVYKDFSIGKRFSYSAADNTIVISPFPISNLSKSVQGANTILGTLFGELDELEAEITQKKITIDGKEYTQFSWKRTDPGGAGGTVTALVDPVTNRAIRIAGEFSEPGPQSFVWDLDYPETGPADIYELGVPRDAKVIDQTDEAN